MCICHDLLGVFSHIYDRLWLESWRLIVFISKVREGIVINNAVDGSPRRLGTAWSFDFREGGYKMGKSRVRNIVRPPPPFNMAKTSSYCIKTTTKVVVPPPPPPRPPSAWLKPLFVGVKKNSRAPPPPPYQYSVGSTNPSTSPMSMRLSLKWMDPLLFG